jgi:hypothetical protein
LAAKKREKKQRQKLRQPHHAEHERRLRNGLPLFARGIVDLPAHRRELHLHSQRRKQAAQDVLRVEAVPENGEGGQSERGQSARPCRPSAGFAMRRGPKLTSWRESPKRRRARTTT